MRLSDLVRQGGRDQARGRKATGIPWQPNDLVQKERNGPPAPPVQGDLPPGNGSGEGLRASSRKGLTDLLDVDELVALGVRASPQDGPRGAAAVEQEGTQGTPLAQMSGDTKRVRQGAIKSVEEILQAVRAHTPFTLVRAERAVEDLLESLQVGDALLVPFFNQDDHTSDLALEAVNMCTLALKMGLVRYAIRMGLVILDT